MQAEVSLSHEQSVGEMRYLALHFKDLQGLRLAGSWGMILVLGLLTRPRTLHGWEMLALLVASVLLCAGSYFFLSRWYQRRYGFLVPSSGTQYHQLPLKIGIHTLGALFCWRMFFSNGEQFIRLMVFGSYAYSSALPFLLRACEQIPMVPSIQLRRAIALMVLATAVISTEGLYMSHVSLNLPYVLIAAALFFASLYDHWLLDRLLRHRPAMEVLHG